MMQGFAEKKAEKLIRVNIDYSEKIDAITISGDFFIHPEEAVELMENQIKGLALSELDLISPRISSLINSHDIRLIGITPQIIEEVVKEAVKISKEERC
jgi:lipoate-protein ligase A